MTPDGLPLAGAGYRLLARIIDVVLVWTVSFALGFPLVLGLLDAMVDYMDMVEKATLNGTTVDPMAVYTTPGIMSNLFGLTAVLLAVSGAYHITFIAVWGATLGKLAAGVRVRPWDVDGRPSWGQAALRWATTDLGAQLPFVGGFYGLLDSLWLLWDNQRQCLHDKLPKTAVIRSR